MVPGIYLVKFLCTSEELQARRDQEFAGPTYCEHDGVWVWTQVQASALLHTVALSLLEIQSQSWDHLCFILFHLWPGLLGWVCGVGGCWTVALCLLAAAVFTTTRPGKA